MKIFSYALLVALTLASITSCKNDSDIKKGSLVPAKFELPNNNASAQKGKTIRIEIDVADLDNVKQIKVFTKDTVIFEGKPTKKQYIFEVDTKTWGLGTNQLSLKTTTNDDKSRNDHRIVKILSDVYPTEYTAEVIKVYPHSTTSFTQGLEFDGDQLFEGTGGRDDQTGVSFVAKVDLNTGEVLEKKTLERKYFGEGITILGDNLYQLTWQEHTCFIYDKNTFEELKQFTYTGEGWGLCNDGKQLIMSDGSERLYFRDTANFLLKKTLEVYSNEGPIKGLNELEYVNGKIYANVYTTNMIVIIDAKTGAVTGKIDASLVALDYRKGGKVLNGIAYRESTKQLFITGKDWPSLLEVGLVEQ